MILSALIYYGMTVYVLWRKPSKLLVIAAEQYGIAQRGVVPQRVSEDAAWYFRVHVFGGSSTHG